MNKIKISFKSILFLIIIISNLSAFTFDKLESGYSFKKVLYWAQDNNMPLCIDDYRYQEDGFKWHSLRNKEKYRIFHYYDIIFNKEATIDLHFTQKSNELYKLIIRWYANEELKKTIIPILDKKYHLSTVSGYINQWRPDNDTLITLENDITGLFLTYTDLSYQHSEYKYKERKQLEIIVKDANKL